jgi:hypothetical protein
MRVGRTASCLIDGLPLLADTAKVTRATETAAAAQSSPT